MLNNDKCCVPSSFAKSLLSRLDQETSEAIQKLEHVQAPVLSSLVQDDVALLYKLNQVINVDVSIFEHAFQAFVQEALQDNAKSAGALNFRIRF